MTLKVGNSPDIIKAIVISMAKTRGQPVVTPQDHLSEKPRSSPQLFLTPRAVLADRSRCRTVFCSNSSHPHSSAVKSTTYNLLPQLDENGATLKRLFQLWRMSALCQVQSYLQGNHCWQGERWWLMWCYCWNQKKNRNRLWTTSFKI